jgi:NAD(P)-dependent dehydrogenase (short-subunit alcohol dehydrogenase family)
MAHVVQDQEKRRTGMQGVDGKVVIVTGAASGIGRATARRLLDDGATVVGADIADSGEDLGERWTYVRADVTDEGAVQSLVAAGVEAGGGRIDGAVTAAGVAGGGPGHLLDEAEWRRVIDINLTGTFLTAKHVIAQLLTQERVDGERGSVVTIASIEGLEGTAGGSAYNASKGGVVLLTKNLAIDYGPSGIRVNAICPGFIDTPMTDFLFGPEGIHEVAHLYIEEHALRRYGQPEEIAAAARFLLSGDASFVSGHAMVVDGGYTAGRDHGITRLLGMGDAV